jgi:penicillin amidase
MLKSMAQTLNNGDKDLEMTNALNLFGPDVVELLYPDREPVGDPIVDKNGQWFSPVTVSDSIALAIPKGLIGLPRLTESDPTIGSNNWAVSGTRTKTGAPILCNDPHLNTSMPSLWYAMQLHAPGINCMGVSLAGLPEIIIGFNDSIAWGLTNAQRDLVDWYRIEFENESMDKYLLNERWIPSHKRVEEFKVRGQESFYDTVVYTTWGPVMFDHSFRGEHELNHYAYRWISHDPSDELDAIYKLNRAQSFKDYMDALNMYSAPAQNFVFASVAGDIAIRVQGKYPVRRKYEGKYVIDGTNSQHIWQAYIPNDQNPVVKNPERGFVSSANQYPTDATYPYYITATSFEAYRNRRINQVLGSDSVVTVEDMMNLQNDNFNQKAFESLPVVAGR